MKDTATGKDPQFTKRLVGASRDGRTNIWKLYCKCGKEFIPSTTMLSVREEECPKCRKTSTVYYSDDNKTPLLTQG